MRFRALLVLLSSAAFATHAAPPAITLQPFVSGLSSPVEIAHANDGLGRLFIAELGGRIRIVRNGQLLPTPFLDLSAGVGGPVITGGERGLLGLAFHPQYADTGRFYVYYTRALSGDANGSEIVVARYNRSAVNPDLADPASASVILTIPHPAQGNHNGGKIAFGPDSYLYIATGDGGGGGDPFNAGQNLNDLRGKLLRIQVDGSPYSIPLGNPFAGSSNPSVRKEIWAYGLRNPWRFSFDRLNGDIYIGDVGQGAWEEINYQPIGEANGGRNYGWRVYEGTHCHNPSTGCSLAGHTLPVIEYPHDSTGGFSVTGGFRYRGTTLPALAGYYVYGDFVSGRMWAAEPGVWTPTLIGSAPSVSAFGEDESGELYAANLNGSVSRLTPAATTIPRLVNISTRGQVLTGNDVMIAGFIVGGSTSKRIVATVAGPSMAGTVPGALADPIISIVRASDGVTIADNDNWQSQAYAGYAQRIQESGFAPANALEPALLMDLPPGAYTAVAQGRGGTGVGLIALYELDHPEVPLINISTRAQVRTDADVLIAGFIVQGNGPQTVVVTAAGPSLTGQGVPGALQNPMLTIVRASDGATIATNDDWQTQTNPAHVAAIQNAGFAPQHPNESAAYLTLPPGAYTAVVQGVGNTTGVGLVAVYRVP